MEDSQKRKLRDIIADAAEKRRFKDDTIQQQQNPLNEETKPTVISLLSDDDEASTEDDDEVVEVQVQVQVQVDDRYRSQIRMIANPEYCKNIDLEADKDAVSLYDLVGSINLKKTYQFNLLIDCGFLIDYFHPNNLDLEIYTINKGDEDTLILNDFEKLSYKFNIIKVDKKLNKFASHHSKMMINFYDDDSCQIIIYTMNLTNPDYKAQTQMCWISPMLKRDPNHSSEESNDALDLITENGKRFKRDFLNYLKSYEELQLNDLISNLEMYNFDDIDVQFIASSPSNKLSFNKFQFDQGLDQPGVKLYGYGKLYQILHEFNLLNNSSNTKFIAQCSSIAAPFDSNKSNLFTHILTSIVEGSKDIVKSPDHDFQTRSSTSVEPVIIWPTEFEVLNSLYRHLSGHAIHLNIERKNNYHAFEKQYDLIKQFFHKWSSSKTVIESKSKRSKLSPHVKTYCTTSNNFKTLDWFLLTSANISKQAWGKPCWGYGSNGKFSKFNKHEFQIDSFEAGIFINPKTVRLKDKDKGKKVVLVPVFGKDTLDDDDDDDDDDGSIVKIPVRLPYDVPLEKYSNLDKPWTVQALERAYENLQE
ncbi:hypothetical protein CANARDRAFT_8539 [[Candida] arabinofermentans NRRL YB-2248]|uniref:Tyrosyl-DNA phosphodiesterase n=1 Tax=[Candida] arabinofermentans NRRL YB-2248 TaxID=983967 RepID=A0A1E4SYH7_9ASCO|nr:hypothetical protein CANARDRAFT_8539 [[Candida] arabinofermentans NRRL YB-2248]